MNIENFDWNHVYVPLKVIGYTIITTQLLVIPRQIVKLTNSEFCNLRNTHSNQAFLVYVIHLIIILIMTL
jgi:hypothetical protein